VAYRYLVDGEREGPSLTHAELDRQARAIGAKLQRGGLRGRRVVLLYPPDLTYVAAFFGSMYAGAIAVPAYPPDPGRLSRTLPRLQAIIADSDADAVLTTSELLAAAQFVFAAAPELEAKEWIATDALEPGTEDSWNDPGVTESDIAFLQYTSGST